MTNLVTFQQTELEVIDLNGQKWLRASQIARALGYDNTSRIADLYRRNKAEFTPEMITTIELPTAGGFQLTRIYSARGAKMLAIFARTEIAAEFRKWILDVLEGKQGVVQLTTPLSSHQINIPISRYVELLEVENIHLRTTRQSRKRLTISEKQEILRLRAMGLGDSAIGQEISRPRGTIGTFLKRHRKEISQTGATHG